MNLRSWVAGAVFAVSAAFPAMAATDAYSTADVNLRAGPDTAYPVIDTILAGEPVTIIGCLSDWSWCDVAWDGIRGWVAGDYLETVYQSRRVYLPVYATLVAFPVITFEFNNYWDTYYYGRPWYRHRDRWRSYWENHDRSREHRREARERPRDRDVVTERLEDPQRARQDRQRDRREARQNRRNRDATVRQDRQRDRQEVRQNRRPRNATVRQDRQRDRQEVRQNRRPRNATVRQDRQRDRQVQQNRRQRQNARQERRSGGGNCRPRANGACR